MSSVHGSSVLTVIITKHSFYVGSGNFVEHHNIPWVMIAIA